MGRPSSSMSWSSPCSVSFESVIVSVGAVLDFSSPLGVTSNDTQSANVLPVVPVGGWRPYG